MKKNIYVAVVIWLLLLVGAGCMKPPSPDTEETGLEATTSSNLNGDENEQMDSKDTVKAGDLTLHAEVLGNRKVKFVWEVDEELAKEAESYRLVHGKKSNPSWPSVYWYQRGPTHREYKWNNLPLGTQHFRVCAVVDDQCKVYSENKEVEVK